MKVAIISPFPPSVGGMAVLAGSLQKAVEKMGIEVIPINTHPEVSNIIFLRKLLKLRQWIHFLINLRKLTQCDVVIIITSSGDYFNSKVMPALYLSRLLKCKTILDFVGGGILEFSEIDKVRIIKKIRKFDHIIVPSTPFKKFFEDQGLKCTLFPHIVEIERFQPSKKNISEPIFLSAKNLMEYSNVESIIKAFSIVQTKVPNAKLFITGNGPQKEFLKSMVADLHLRNVIFFEGLTNEQMPSIFNQATIFLHGTRIESFGIAIVEALASGTPVVSSNVGGIPDIIKDGLNGFLVDYNNHEEMAQRIMTLLSDENLYNHFVAEGLKTAHNYSANVLAPQLMELLDTVVT